MKKVEDALSNLMKAKYLRREGTPGNYTYYYKEPNKVDVKDAISSLDRLKSELNNRAKKVKDDDLESANELFLDMDNDAWDEWSLASKKGKYKSLKPSFMKDIKRHKDSLKRHGNKSYTKDQVEKFKNNTVIIATDGSRYKAVDGQHRINYAIEENRDQPAYIVTISKELLDKVY